MCRVPCDGGLAPSHREGLQTHRSSSPAALDGARLTVVGGMDVPDPSLIAAVHAALVVALHVPDDDPTVWIEKVVDEDAIVAGRHAGGLVLVSVTMLSGRTASTRRLPHREIAERLGAVGISGDGVMCVIGEVDRSSLSIGGVPQDEVVLELDVDV